MVRPDPNPLDKTLGGGKYFAQPWCAVSFDHRRAFVLIKTAFDADPGAKLRDLYARLKIHRDTGAAIIWEAAGLKPEVWRQREINRQATELLVGHPTKSVKEVAAQFKLTTNGLRRLTVRQCGLTPTEIRRTRTRR